MSLLYTRSSPETVHHVLVEKVEIFNLGSKSQGSFLLAVRLNLPAWLAVAWVSLKHVENLSTGVGLGARAASFLLLLFTLISFGL